MPSPSPLVSVSVLTYQHERYLATALDSVLAQETDFDFEVVVGVDGGGADATADIARDYAARYPDRVRAICHAVNGPGVAGRANNIHNLGACRGRYIALLDGDDLFSDVTKLQRQANALEADPGLGLSFHDTEVFWEGGQRAPERFYATRTSLVRDRERAVEFTLRDLAAIGHSAIPSSSMMLRASAIRPLPPWFSNILAADFALQLLACTRARARYEPIVASRYRKHAASVLQTDWYEPENLERKLGELDVYADHFGLRRSTFDYRRAWTAYSLGEKRAAAGEYGASGRALANALVAHPLVFAKRTKDVALRLLQTPRVAPAPAPVPPVPSLATAALAHAEAVAELSRSPEEAPV